MVTRILFDPRVDLPDGSSTSSPVVVEATQTGIRASGAVVTFPTTLSFSIASAADVIQLAAPSVGHAWRLVVRRQASTRYGGFVTPTGGATLEARTVTWADAPTVTWAALTDVDPATLSPATIPSAAWDALQAQIAALPTSGGAGAVASVNGHTGAVVLAASDVGADPAGAVDAISLAGLGGLTQTQIDARVAALADVKGAAAAVTLTSLGGVTPAAVDARFTSLVGAAPAALDTLGELATQLQSDETAAGALTTLVGTKAPIASPTFTGTVGGISKAMVGLGSVDNTADTGKPVSTAQAAADAAVQAFAVQRANHTGTQAASTITGLATVATSGSKVDVGLGSVDNTADSAKPVSTAQQAALDTKAALATIADPAWQQTAADGASLASPWQQFTTRPQRPASKVVFRFLGATGWTGTTVTDDTSTVLFGDRTVKNALTASQGVGADSPSFTAQDWSSSIIRLWMKVDVPANVSQVIMYVYMTGGGIASVGVSANFQAGEWLPITLPRVGFGVAAGTLNWASVTKVTVQTNAAASGPLISWVGGIDLIPDLAATYPSGVMICEMDDGYLGQKTYGLPVFASRGIPVTYNPIGDRFVGGSPASGMTVSDLRTFQDVHGWEISCHAYASAAHGSSVNSVATMEADFQRQKQWLHANGLHAGTEHYALCPGTGSPVAAGTMMQALEKSFRSVRVNSGYYETASPGDPLRLRSVLFSGAGNSVANVKANIDKCAGAGGAFIFAMHDVIAGATDGTSNSLPAIAATNLGTILDYAASKGMVFRTRADYVDGR